MLEIASSIPMFRIGFAGVISLTIIAWMIGGKKNDAS